MQFSPLNSGTSVLQEPIAAFKSEVKAQKYIYLIAGVHGDEVEGVYVLDQLFKWLQEDEVLEDLPLIVVPILNVDGYKAQTRVNAHHVDLNRNLPTDDWSSEFKQDKYNPGKTALSEPENIFLDKLFEHFKPGFILSFHSWKPILNYNGDCKDIAEFLSKYNNYPIDSDIGYPTPGSLGTYGPAKYGAGVLTFECPPFSEEKTLKNIWDENKQGLQKLFYGQLLSDKLA